MPELIDKIYDERQVHDADGNAINPFPASIRRGLGEAFAQLITDRDLTNSIEIGLAYGMSALFIAGAHKTRGIGTHVAVDPGQDSYHNIGKLNLQRAGLDDITEVVEAPSYAALPAMLADGRRFDFAFIDGMHLFDFTLVDFFYIDLMLDVGGIVVFDDIGMKACRSAAMYAMRNRSYERVPIATTAGVPPHVKAGRIARKVVSDPFSLRDLSLKLTAEGVVVLEKTADDTRPYDHHELF